MVASFGTVGDRKSVVFLLCMPDETFIVCVAFRLGGAPPRTGPPKARARGGGAVRWREALPP